MAIVLVASGAGWAADSWVGGAVSVGAATMAGVEALPLQAELDVRAEGEHVALRLDLDVHLQPVHNQDVIEQPYPIEWGMLQVGAGDDPFRVRLGITNPPVAMEDLDAWNNPLPTFSLMSGATPGRLLGGEVAVHRPDGTEVFAWGGADLDFVGYPPIEGDTIMVPTVGVGVVTEQDAFGTRSGIASWPAGERDTEGDAMHGLFAGLELYPDDAWWITMDGSVGIRGRAPFAGGALVLEAFPEGRVTGVARAEGVIDPDDAALGGAIDGVLDGTLGAGARVRPVPALLLQMELKALFENGGIRPGGAVLVTLHRPEPATDLPGLR